MEKRNELDGKFMTTVKVGPKGQIIVPKECRDMFGIEPGDMLLMLADKERGIALQTYENSETIFKAAFPQNMASEE